MELVHICLYHDIFITGKMKSVASLSATKLQSNDSLQVQSEVESGREKESNEDEEGERQQQNETEERKGDVMIYLQGAN